MGAQGLAGPEPLGGAAKAGAARRGAARPPGDRAAPQPCNPPMGAEGLSRVDGLTNGSLAGANVRSWKKGT
jgi:hypothetical protein